MNPIADSIEGFLKGASDILGKFVTDPTKKLEAETELVKLAMNTSLAQLEVNKAEAQNASVFVSGWRPFVGWVCGFSLAYAVIGFTFLTWVLEMAELYVHHTLPPLPPPDITITMEILMGMLGLGGLRTYEKLKGVSR